MTPSLSQHATDAPQQNYHLISKPKRKIIGLSGGAGAGKDTFFNILNTLTPCKRFALADSLKSDLKESILKNHGFDIFNCSLEQKNFVRPLLVAYGKGKRESTNGGYWTSKLQSLVENDVGSEIIVITDIRYVVYEKDEYHWLKNTMGGDLIFIQNYWQNLASRTFPEPINDDERHNNKILRELCDYYVEWPIIQKSLIENKSFLFEALKPYVEQFHDWFSRRRTD